VRCTAARCANGAPHGCVRTDAYSRLWSGATGGVFGFVTTSFWPIVGDMRPQRRVFSAHEMNVLMEYKVKQCPDGDKCESTKCWGWHCPEERRRVPYSLPGRILAYPARKCAAGWEGRKGECSCVDGAHNVYEFRYHPDKYHKMPCNNRTCKLDNLCAYLHVALEPVRTYGAGRHDTHGKRSQREEEEEEEKHNEAWGVRPARGRTKRWQGQRMRPRASRETSPQHLTVAASVSVGGCPFEDVRRWLYCAARGKGGRDKARSARRGAAQGALRCKTTRPDQF